MMKKTSLIIGSIEITLGLILLFTSTIIKEIIPKIARMCFMFNTGSFTEGDYIINVGFANKIAIILCLIGITTIVYFLYIDKEK